MNIEGLDHKAELYRKGELDLGVFPNKVRGAIRDRATLLAMEEIEAKASVPEKKAKPKAAPKKAAPKKKPAAKKKDKK